jgi:uncharacterized membrane protein
MTTDEPKLAIENSIFIARPTEDIWSFLTDIVNDQQWRKGLIDTRWTSDEPSSIGSTAVYIFEGIGEVHWKLTEWEEQRVMGWDYIGGRLDGGHGSYRMQPEAGGTRMVMRMEMKAGLIFRIFMKFIVTRQNVGDLKKLKAIMEA